MNSVLLLILAEVPAFGFTTGVEALDVGAPAAEVRAKKCAGCHETETEQWSKSRHRVAATNAIFRAGFEVEPEARCIRCHSPLPEQVAETARLVRTKEDDYAPDAFTHEGVTCAACHVRDGEAHGNDALRSDELCGSCHQFAFHEKHGGVLELKDLLIQSTYAEWQRYASAGGAGTCISCHMPDGTHDIRGAHDLDLLRQSLRIEATDDALTLRTVGVGHDFPTGDVFRHVTIEARTTKGWIEIARLGRRYDAAPNPDGTHSMVLTGDTALRPGERRKVVLPPDTAAYRVRYRYTRAGDVFREIVTTER